MKAPYFLNVDLDIESESPLDSVAQEFGNRVVVMRNDRIKGRYCLSVACAEAGRTQNAVLKALCSLIERLSEKGRCAWDAAEKREFNLGYETRLRSARANGFKIHPDTLRRITNLGASVAVTIYPEER